MPARSDMPSQKRKLSFLRDDSGFRSRKRGFHEDLESTEDFVDFLLQRRTDKRRDSVAKKSPGVGLAPRRGRVY